MTEEHCFIIPNYNGATFISKTLENTININAGKIIVIDDNSSDKSQSIIEQFSVTLIVRHENGGFAAAVNSGLQEAESRGFKYASVMNSDIELPVGFASTISSVIKTLESKNEYAVAGFVESGTKRLLENDQISGFFFTLKLSVIRSVGFLNEEFFMYGEETEFFRRVLHQNYKIIQTGLEIKHLGEKSSQTTINTSWYAIRNAIFLELIHARYIKAIQITLVLFLTINNFYFPKGANSDPSFRRLKRVGVLSGNYYLIKAIFWNIKRAFR